MAKTYTLARDGQRPVRFAGTLVAAEPGKMVSGKEQTRYYDVALYLHEDGRYIVHWCYRTHWQGEEQHSAVSTHPTLHAAVSALEDFDPINWVEGYKAFLVRHPTYSQAGSGSGYRERQEELERSIRARYRAQVSALCADVDSVEDL